MGEMNNRIREFQRSMLTLLDDHGHAGADSPAAHQRRSRVWQLGVRIESIAMLAAERVVEAKFANTELMAADTEVRGAVTGEPAPATTLLGVPGPWGGSAGAGAPAEASEAVREAPEGTEGASGPWHTTACSAENTDEHSGTVHGWCQCQTIREIQAELHAKHVALRQCNEASSHRQQLLQEAARLLDLVTGRIDRGAWVPNPVLSRTSIADLQAERDVALEFLKQAPAWDGVTRPVTWQVYLYSIVSGVKRAIADGYISSRDLPGDLGQRILDAEV